MLTVDIVFGLLLIGFFIGGYRKGLVVAFGQLLGVLIGFTIARHSSAWLGDLIGKWFHANAGIAHIIAFVLIFLLVDRLFGLVIGLIDRVVKILSIIPFLSTINGLLGSILGLLEGVVLLGSSVYLIKSLYLHPTLVAWVTQSRVAPFLEQVFYKALGFLLLI